MIREASNVELCAISIGFNDGTMDVSKADIPVAPFDIHGFVSFWEGDVVVMKPLSTVARMEMHF